jgi:hypothetical protein
MLKKKQRKRKQRKRKRKGRRSRVMNGTRSHIIKIRLDTNIECVLPDTILNATEAQHHFPLFVLDTMCACSLRSILVKMSMPSSPNWLLQTGTHPFTMFQTGSSK